MNGDNFFRQEVPFAANCFSSPHNIFFSLAVHFCKVDFLLGFVKE